VLSTEDFEAYDHLPLPIWVFSVETLRILRANTAALDLTGYDRQALQAATIDFLHPDVDRGKVVDLARQFNGPRADVGTWTIVAKSGVHFTATFTWSKVSFEGADAVVVSARPEISRSANATLHGKTGSPAAYLSSLFNTLPGKMLLLTPKGYRVVAVTSAYARAVGVEHEDILGLCIFDLCCDDPAEIRSDASGNLRASLQRVVSLRSTDVMNLERYPVGRPDGAWRDRPLLSRNKPVLDADGHVVYIVHYIEDMPALSSQRGSADGDVSDPNSVDTVQSSSTRTAFLSLQEREKRLKTAERLLNLGAWEYEFERGALSWSDRVFEIYGVPHDREPPNFDDYVALVHPDDRDQMLATYTHFFESRAPDIVFQHRIVRSDGTTSHIRGVGTRHHVDDRELVIGFVQDITHANLVEEELLRQARRRRLAGRLARLGSWRVDLSPMHLSWDEETAAIHDEPEGFSPTLDQAVAYYIPEHRERIRARFEACAQEGRHFDESLQIVTAKGRRVWVHALGEPVFDASGQVVAVEGAFQDITDLVAVQDEAAELSVRLRGTLEGMSDAFFLLDDDWRFAFVNSQAESLLRRPRNDLLGNIIWEEFPEAAGSIFQEQYADAMDNQKPVRFQAYYPPLAAWFEVSADPTPAGLAVYFRDVTQTRTRDTQLRLLEAAVSRLNDILVITEAEPIDGPEGPRIVYVNDAFERRTGYSREEAIGRTPRILQGPRTERAELDRIRGAMEAWQPIRSELINYTKSGEEFWLELDIVPLADEKGWFTHWIAVERDVTQRKRAELDLQINEERFQLVTKAAGSAIWDWDVASGRQWWSKGLEATFGHQGEQFGSGPAIWRAHIHPEDIERIDAAFENLVSGEDHVLRDQYRFQRADGSWASVEHHAFGIRDAEGKVCRVLGSMTDVTEKTLLEERLRQAQKMESVGQLTGGIAHDFNNLLTIILGASEMLDEELRDLPQIQGLAKMAMEAAERGAELTRRLLVFSRKQPLETKVIDAARAIQAIEVLLRRTFPENIDIEIVRAGGLWKIETDPAQLEAAVLNLSVNARDAMPEGGSLTIEVANAVLDRNYVNTEPDIEAGQYVVIMVTDTGQGMTPEVMSRVFEPFFTTKETGKGTGLGLSMVFGFIKQSGGHVRVYSEPGEGTSFKLYFPRSRAAQTGSVTDRAVRKVSGGTETILVVEDDAALREHVRVQLQGLGYTVLHASTAAEAVEIMNQPHHIDLLFTDVVMPGGMGGRDLASLACSLRPSLRVLFTSGYTENSFAHTGRLYQGAKLLGKPYRREQLFAKIREALEDEASRH